MSSAALPITVISASGYARRATSTNREPPTPPAKITIRTPTSVPSTPGRYAEGVDRLMRLREPATVVALIGMALHFALTLVFFLLAPVPFDLLLVDLALALVNPALVALLTVLVASCWIPEATH